MSPPDWRWVAGCAAAESMGLGAAAAAALIAGAVGGGAGRGSLAVGVIVAAGIVEGLCLGGAQAWLLTRTLPLLPRRRFVAVTVLVAGVGWAAGSAPMVISADDGGAAPPLLVLLSGAAALGLLMGGLLGGAQAWTMRRATTRPMRWMWANVAAWPGAMAVIFLGTTLPDADWSELEVVLVGAGSGAVAGAVLGLVLGRAASVSEGSTSGRSPRAE